MPKFIQIPESETVKQLQFFCPGCKTRHSLNTTWQFNNDFESPTAYPSVLVTWAEGDGTHPPIAKRCHSFIKDGMIQFLNDCTHDLKNQTVELPQIS